MKEIYVWHRATIYVILFHALKEIYVWHRATIYVILFHALVLLYDQPFLLCS